MKIIQDQVYLLCAPANVIDNSVVEAPFDAYRDLAWSALRALDLPDCGRGDVLLKSNATVLGPPDGRIITHPGFLGGLIDALVEKGVAQDRLVVADGQSGEQPDQGRTWESCGYQPMADARGVTLTELNDGMDRQAAVPDGVVYNSFGIHKRVTDCGLLLNVPVAKCHNLSCTTLSVKNLMGVVTRPQRHLCSIQEVDKPLADDLWRMTDTGLSVFENRFCDKLCDLVTAVRGIGMVRLNAVDGLIGRDGTAFNEGENHPLGWTVIGQNEIHVDAVATYLMGLDPGATPYLIRAVDRGLGAIRIEEIDVIDLANGQAISPAELARLRAGDTLMPISRFKEGYYDRFRADGSVVPWRIDDVNALRQTEGVAPVPLS